MLHLNLLIWLKIALPSPLCPPLTSLLTGPFILQKPFPAWGRLKDWPLLVDFFCSDLATWWTFLGSPYFRILHLLNDQIQMKLHHSLNEQSWYIAPHRPSFEGVCKLDPPIRPIVENQSRNSSSRCQWWKTQVDLSVPPQLQLRSPTQTNHSVPTGDLTLTMMIIT